MTTRSDWRGRRGLTLVELMLALGLIAVVLLAMVVMYDQCLAQRERGRNISQRAQLARVVLQQIAADIRRAVPMPEGSSEAVSGSEYEVQFATMATPERAQFIGDAFTGANPRPVPDLELVRYFLKIHPTLTDPEGNAIVLGLFRESIRSPGFISPPQAVQTPTGDQLGDSGVYTLNDTGASTPTSVYQVSESVVSEEIKFVRFRYSNGTGWQDTWSSGSDPLLQLTRQSAAGGQGSRFPVGGLPQAVEITIGFEPDAEMVSVELQLELAEETPVVERPDYNPATAASTADIDNMHPDRFITVTSLPMAEKVLGPLVGKVSSAASKFGSGQIESFMQQGFDLGSFNPNGGSQGQRTGPSGPLFGGQP